MSIKDILTAIAMRSKNAWAWCKAKWKQLGFLDRLIVVFVQTKQQIMSIKGILTAMTIYSKIWARCKAKWKKLGFLDRLIIAFAIVFILVMFLLGSCYPFTSIECLLGISDKKEILTFIGIGIGGLVLWQRARSAKEQADAMVKATEHQAETNKITEIGRVQERLKTSIEHLGNKKESVRIGAAYELYHLAADHKDYRKTVCDILCSHIRQTTQEDEYKKQHTNRPSEEIQTFLNLLCGREKGDIFNPYQRNLASSFLRGAYLSGAQLQGANLLGAQLQGAKSLGAQLQGTVLWEAQLQGACLAGAQLQGTSLLEAQLQGANLLGAQLQGANLWKAQLQGAELQEAQLQGTSLLEAQLQGAILTRAQLQGTVLWEAQLQGARLLEAQLQGASLWQAQIQEAVLTRAHLQGTGLTRAHLQEAKLRSVRLQGTILAGAQIQEISSLDLPPYLNFQNLIRDRIGHDNDFTNVIFSGGLSADRVKEIIASMPSIAIVVEEELESRLSKHIDRPASYKLPENSEAITGKYSKEEAEQWIKEYDKAMESVPEKQPDLGN